MDLSYLDQMFTMRKGHIEQVWQGDARPRVGVKLIKEIEKWLADNKVRYTFTPCGITAVLHIHDRKWATMFKLTWM